MSSSSMGGTTESWVTKYRPRSLKSVVGQKKAVALIRGMLEKKMVPSTILITGKTGVGKTTLVRWLIEQDTSDQKIIFSFKEDDEYLKMDLPILDVSKTAPNPFYDFAAFTNAFMTANPIESVGIQASSIKPRLLKLLAHAKTWKELVEQIDVQEYI